MKFRYLLQIKFTNSSKNWDIEEHVKSFAYLLKFRSIIDETVQKAQVVDLLTYKIKIWK